MPLGKDLNMPEELVLELVKLLRATHTLSPEHQLLLNYLEGVMSEEGLSKSEAKQGTAKKNHSIQDTVQIINYVNNLGNIPPKLTEALIHWQKQLEIIVLESIQTDKQEKVDAEPNDIELLLLYGMLAPVKKWPYAYYQSLMRIKKMQLIEATKDFPAYLLPNLLFFQLQGESFTTQKRAVFDLTQNPSPFGLIYTENLFVEVLKLRSDKLSLSEKGNILTAAKEHLGTLISCSRDLFQLLISPPEWLSDEQKEIILTAMVAQPDTLGKVISDFNGLFFLLSLPQGDLTVVQKDRILTAIQGQLPKLIRNGAELYQLLRISVEQLSGKQRETILTAIQGQLPKLISNGAELYQLLRISVEQLSGKQRETILTAIQGQLPRLISNGKDLCQLLSISIERLSREQREIILTAMVKEPDILCKVITNFNDLHKLLSLLREEQIEIILTAMVKQPAILGKLITKLNDLRELLWLLTEEQRKIILTAIQGQLPKLISNCEDLYQLLLPLTVDQTQIILTAMVKEPDILCKVITNFNDLQRLLSLLSVEQREIILTAIQGQLLTLISNGAELYQLLSIAANQLSGGQREIILKAIQGQLPKLISNGADLYQLLSISVERLSGGQREIILKAIQGQLPKLISNGADLYQLLSISVELLSGEQREIILTAIQGQLPTLISNGEDLCQLWDSFLGLSKNQLSLAREVILKAIVERPDMLIKNKHDCIKFRMFYSHQFDEGQIDQIEKALKLQEPIKDILFFKRQGGIRKDDSIPPKASNSCNP